MSNGPSKGNRERELERARWLLEEAQAVAHVGSWVSGVGEDDGIEWSAETYRIFGVADGEPMTVPKFFEFVHPDDRERVRTAAEAAIDHGAPYSIEHRIIRPDGTTRVVHERASIVDRPGEPRLFVGTVLDVTERVRFEERDRFLAATSARMSEAFEFPKVLGEVAESAVPAFADACAVFLDDEEHHSIAVHRELARRTALHQCLQGVRQRLRAIPVGTVVVYPSVPADSVYDCLDLVTQVGATSLICVSLQVRHRSFGAILMFREGDSPDYDEFDVDTAVDFARRAAFAIDNARLYAVAQDSVRARDEFVAIAAHELRTPLTPLRLQAHLLNSMVANESFVAKDDQPQLDMLARDIQRSSDRLISLVEQLLDVSQMTVGGAGLQYESLDLNEFAHEIADELADDLARAGSEIDWKLQADPVVGDWDRRNLELALRNLITNAMKFAPGPIEISIGANDDIARLSVRDYGRGLPQEAQTQLFERYRRSAPLRYYGGFGLGLWIVRRSVEQLGGRVEVWSEPGAGARFTLVLPRKPGAPLPEGGDSYTDEQQGSQV